MAEYYVAPINTHGSGTLANPWGIPDLFTTPGTSYVPGVALTTLQPGDTLFFRGGIYNLNSANNSVFPLLAPTHSGTAGNPITFQCYPGEPVTVLEVTGVNPVFGTMTPASLPSNHVINYVRFLGFTVKTTLQSDVVGSGFHISGIGCEVGYCDFYGSTKVGTDNHPGIRVDFADSAWIHHNYIHDVVGPNGNSCGTESYQSTNCLFEDNHIVNCTDGLHDKDCGTNAGGNNNTYRRNWVTGSGSHCFQGNNQNAVATYLIYDNVFQCPSPDDFGIDLGDTNDFFTSPAGTFYGANSQVYNNLIFVGNPKFLTVGGNTGAYLSSAWNNIVLNGGTTFVAYNDPFQTLPNDSHSALGATAVINYLDYNVYDGAPTYKFTAPNDNMSLANIRAFSPAYETHTVQDTAANIFVDQVAYVLKTAYQTAGRFSDEVGPRSTSPTGPTNALAPSSVARILDASRYGPSALGGVGSLRVHTASTPWTIQTAANSLLAGQTTCSFAFAIRVNSAGSTSSNLVLKQGGSFVIGGSSAQLAVVLSGALASINYRFTPVLGQTYYIAGSFSPSAGLVYNQAQLVQTVNSPGATPVGSKLLQLGWQASAAADYTISQLTIWHGYALTHNDALALRGGASPRSISPGNLAAYWNFLGPAGANPQLGDPGLQDGSGHGNHFTVLAGSPILAAYDSPLVYVPPTVIEPQVAKSGKTAYVYAVNSTGTPGPQPITAVNSDPVFSVQFGGAGSSLPVQAQGPYCWIPSTHEFPFVAYQLSCGPVESVVVQDGGADYDSPTATATGGGGTGCVLGDPVVVDGVITEIPVITPGDDYTSPPAINIIGGGGSGASAAPIMGGVQPDDVVTYAADDSFIIAASGPAPAAPSVYATGAVTNSSGSLEPPVGGYLPFDLPAEQRTMQVGTQMSGQSSSFFTQYNASCNWLKRTADPWTNAVTSTPDGHPITITGIASSVFTGNSAQNFVDGRISPDMTGVWTLTIDDTDTTTPMQYRVVSNDGAGVISPSDFGAANVSAGTVVDGVLTGRVYQFTVTRAPDASRLDMVLVLQVKKPGATGTYAYTAQNEYMFSPIATAAALPGLPARVSPLVPDQSLPNWVNTPSGKSIASIRLHSGDGFGLSNVIDADDLLDPDDFTWSQARRTFTVSVTAVRTYSIATAAWPAQFGSITWSSPNIYVSVWNHTTGGAGYPIDSIRIKNGGADYTTATAAAVPTNGGSGCVLGTPVIVGGAIVSIPVISHGTAHKTPPTITITGDGSGATAYPVAAIAVPTQNWGNLGGNSYCGELVCAAPHGLIAGQAVSRVTGTNSFTISNGSTSTLTSFIPTIGGYVWPTSPTTLAFFNNNGNMNQSTVGIPGGMNNVVGSQPVSLTLTFNMPDLGTKPYEFTGACAGSLPDCSLHLSVTPQLSDACLAVIARKVRDAIPAGRHVAVEYGNENWNFTFPMFGFSGLTSGLGVFGSAAAGGPNNCYAIRAGQVHKILFDVFSQAGRGGEIIRAFGSQMTNPAITTFIVTKINAYNASSPPVKIPIDEIKVASYLSMPVTTGAISTTMAAASLASGKPLSIAYGHPTPWTRTAYLELARHCIKYSATYNGPTGVFAKHQTEIAKYIPVASEGLPEITSYEGALEAMVPAGVETGPDGGGKYLRNQLSHDLYYDPELYHCYMAYLQMCQQGGMTLLHSTSHCYPMTGSGAEGAATTFWGLTNWAGQPAGRGDGTGTTTLGCVGPIDGVNAIGTPITNKFWIDDGLSHHVDNTAIQMQALRDWIDVTHDAQTFTAFASSTASFHDVAFVPRRAGGPAQAASLASFHDVAVARAGHRRSASAHDSFGFIELARAISGGRAGDLGTFTEIATSSRSHGRARHGDKVKLAVSSRAVPDSSPIAIVMDSENNQVFVGAMPATDRSRMVFELPILVGVDFPLGTFTVYYYYSVAGVQVLQQGTLTVVAGGDTGGSVISMHALDRAEARSIVAQIEGGQLVLGRNPGTQ